MKLNDYLRENGISGPAFARRIGMTRQSVYFYRNGRVLPRPEVIRRIEAATGGKVAVLDFYNQTKEKSDGET